MKARFDVIFLEQAIEFVENLDSKTRNKIFYNIDKAKLINDPKLFKKLKMKFGNLGQSIKGFKSDFLHFGTKLEILKLS